MPLMSGKAAPLSRPTPWRTVIVLCRKCGKKRDGGFGAKRKESLKAELRAAGCFGLCPKRGVTALNATRPGVIHVIPVGTDGPEALQTLFGGDGVESA